MSRRPPRSTRTDTLCPYTTLFRSFSPIALTAAMAGRGGFQPRSFAVPAPPPVVDAAIAAPQPAEDPFAHGLAEGQRLAETAFSAERHRLLALHAATGALQEDRKSTGLKYRH